MSVFGAMIVFFTITTSVFAYGGGGSCSNGATNPPACNACPIGQQLELGACVVPVNDIVITTTAGPVEIEATGGCNNIVFTSTGPYPSSVNFTAPYGKQSFKLNCHNSDPTSITVTFTGFQNPNSLLKKVSLTNALLNTLDDTPTINSSSESFSYQVSDGGANDEDGVVNGEIDDPFVLLVPVVNNAPTQSNGVVFTAGSGAAGGGPLFFDFDKFKRFINIFTTNNGTTTITTVATSSAENCAPYISQYGWVGTYSNDVVKLKQFLNKHEGENLGESKLYNFATYSAVKRYQTKYGVTPRSGLQLNRTTAVVNKQYCYYQANGL